MARWLTGFCCAFCLLSTADLLQAAELTDVIDADDGDDPFDFIGTVHYRRSLRRAKITREYNCNGVGTATDDSPCGNGNNEGELMTLKELRYEKVVHEIVPELRFGLWHDLELRIEMPIVISSSAGWRFAGDGGGWSSNEDSKPVDPSSSSIAPDNDAHLFEVTDKWTRKTRSGLGDMLFELKFAPLSRERDDTRGDWMLSFGYRAPTGKTMKGNNDGVGRGVHELNFATAFSYRFSLVDPYVRLGAVIPIPAGDTLFEDYGGPQDHVGPGSRVNLDFGTEIVALDRPRQGYKLMIDLGVGADYQAKGRDYSELFDALAHARATCKPEYKDSNVPNCALYNTDSESRIAGQPISGVTTVDEFMTFRGHLGMGTKLAHHVQFGFDLALAYETAHFLSSASVGKDLNGDRIVGSEKKKDGSSGKKHPEEYNPVYSKAIDAPGRRLRIEETTVFTASAYLSVLF